MYVLGVWRLVKTLLLCSADIRQSVGFKNVSLGNVLAARDTKERVTFIHSKDQDKFRNYVGRAFEVQVSLHTPQPNDLILAVYSDDASHFLPLLLTGGAPRASRSRLGQDLSRESERRLQLPE